MTGKEFIKKIRTNREALRRLVGRTLPIKAGARAVSFFQENFRKGGFQGATFQRWQPVNRSLARGADRRRTPLLSSRKHLYSSFTRTAQEGTVTIRNTTPYAAIHNEGGTVRQRRTITSRMRRFAWAQYYKSGEDMWKGLALTKKTSLNVTIVIPQRRFMADSPVLTAAIRDIITKDINHILNN